MHKTFAFLWKILGCFSLQLFFFTAKVRGGILAEFCQEDAQNLLHFFAQYLAVALSDNFFITAEVRGGIRAELRQEDGQNLCDSLRNAWLLFLAIIFSLPQRYAEEYAQSYAKRMHKIFSVSLRNTWLFFLAIIFLYRRGTRRNTRRVTPRGWTKPLRFFAKCLVVVLSDNFFITAEVRGGIHAELSKVNA